MTDSETPSHPASRSPGAIRALLARMYLSKRRGVRGWGLRRFRLLKDLDRFAHLRGRSAGMPLPPELLAREQS